MLAAVEEKITREKHTVIVLICFLSGCQTVSQ
jgi:hypothetical protein